MKIVIVGGSGYIGSQLSDVLGASGHQVVKLSHLQISTATLNYSDVIINLAGATVSHRWTSRYMQKIYRSRISTTNRLVNIINILPHKPSLMINASAVGIYGIGGVYDESEEFLGGDFLSDVCRGWESEAVKVSSDVRLVIMRLGVVLSRDGGVLGMLLKDTSFLRVSVQVGDGEAFLPWISVIDLERAVQFLIERDDIRGVVNMVAPAAIKQGDMARSVGRMCGVKSVVRMPLWFLKLVLGKGAVTLMDSRRVTPRKLLDAGFEFSVSDIESVK